MKDKIIFIGDASSIHIKKWVDFFIKNYDTYLITFSTKNITNCKNVFFMSNIKPKITGNNFHYIFYINAIAKIFKNIKPDYIVSHYSYSLGFIGLLAKKIAKIRCVYGVVCHGSDILDLPKPKFLYKKINKFVLNNSDKIFAVSDQIYDEIIKMKINENKIFVGQYGINLNKNFDDLFIKDIDILSNRNFVSNSRWDFILNNINDMNLKNKNIVFIMPGVGKKIKKLKNKYPYIHFYEKVTYDEMINLFKRAKVYISATQNDGTSLSLLEAMYYGAIPLVSNIVSNRSWIIDNLNGFLFRNSIEFKDKLNQILNMSDKKLENIKEINNRLIFDKANYNKQMQKIEQFIKT
jgi:glycosyltransferase involved in cell wall biosynthesis